jgi:hypothetical protein
MWGRASAAPRAGAERPDGHGNLAPGAATHYSLDGFDAPQIF